MVVCKAKALLSKELGVLFVHLLKDKSIVLSVNSTPTRWQPGRWILCVADLGGCGSGG